MILVNADFIKNSGKTMHYARGLMAASTGDV